MDDLLAEFERPHQPSPEDKERRRRLFAAVGIAGLSLVALGSLTTNALFTDTDQVNSSGFTTGTIDISAAPATVAFGAGNMAPGDTVYGYLHVDNAGTLGLRYNMSATGADGTGTGTGSLRSQLEFEAYRGVNQTDCENGDVSGGTAFGGAAAPIGASRTFLTYADDRRLTAGASDNLCVVASLPLSTGNTFQDTTMTATFVFNAEQTKNNP